MSSNTKNRQPTNNEDDDDDDDQRTLSLEEIAAEAHRHHRPQIARRETPASEVGELPTFPRGPLSSSAVTPPPVPSDSFSIHQHHHHYHHHYDDDYDDDLLHRAVADAGRWAYGTVLVEVWIHTGGTTLIRPTSGWWLDPMYPLACRQTTTGTDVSRLVDETRPDYVPPTPLVPGEGLPGVLWAELEGASYGARLRHTTGTNNNNNNNSRRNFSTRRTGASGGIFATIQKQQHGKAQGVEISELSGLSSSRGGSRRGIFRGLSNASRSKKHGHKRAISLPLGSADVNVPSKNAPAQSLAGSASGRGQGRIWNGSHRSKDPLSHQGTFRGFPSAGVEGHGRRHRRYTTNIEDAALIAAMAEEEVHDMEKPIVVPTVVWRDVNALANDPDQPWNPRLKLLAECNLGWAAAVPLRRHGQTPHGIVIYLARSSVDIHRLQSPTNEAYLTSAADLITSALLIRGPRHAAIEKRRAEMKRAARIIRWRLLFLLRIGWKLEDIMNGNNISDESKTTVSVGQGRAEVPQGSPPIDSFAVSPIRSHLATRLIQTMYWLRTKMVTTLMKTRGGAVQAPPTFSWEQTAVTFVGVFWTIAALAWLNTHLVSKHGTDADILLGPFGALVTLLYGLTAAPASQPRNAILGQTVSVGIVLLLHYIPPWENLHIAWRAAISTALAVSTMVRLGLIHPPAGAAALLFSLSPDRWEGLHLAVLLLANVVAIVLAVIFNNLSDRRQYPTFWGFDLLDRLIHHIWRDTQDQPEKTI